MLLAFREGVQERVEGGFAHRKKVNASDGDAK